MQKENLTIVQNTKWKVFVLQDLFFINFSVHLLAMQFNFPTIFIRVMHWNIFVEKKVN